MTIKAFPADRQAVVDFNHYTPIGSPVRYWAGVHEGDGKQSRTRTAAHLLSGHTPVVWVEGEASCLALTHVEVLGGVA